MMWLPVLKNKIDGKFIVVSRNILKDKRLKLVDRGLLVTLLSLPDKWNFSIRGLAVILPDGRDAIRASLSRLEQMGYLTRSQERSKSGRFGEIYVEVHQIPVAPCNEKPYMDKSYSDRPVTVDLPQYDKQVLDIKQMKQKNNFNIVEARNGGEIKGVSGKYKKSDNNRKINTRRKNTQVEEEWTSEEAELYGL